MPELAEWFNRRVDAAHTAQQAERERLHASRMAVERKHQEQTAMARQVGRALALRITGLPADVLETVAPFAFCRNLPLSGTASRPPVWMLGPDTVFAGNVRIENYGISDTPKRRRHALFIGSHTLALPISVSGEPTSRTYQGVVTHLYDRYLLPNGHVGRPYYRGVDSLRLATQDEAPKKALREWSMKDRNPQSGIALPVVEITGNTVESFTWEDLEAVVATSERLEETG